MKYHGQLMVMMVMMIGSAVKSRLCFPSLPSPIFPVQLGKIQKFSCLQIIERTQLPAADYSGCE